jgi:hypothetical protein
MTDSDFTFIQPVENLHSVQSLTPAKQQEERKRRQKPPSPQSKPGETPLNETPQAQNPDRNSDQHKIDYCA